MFQTLIMALHVIVAVALIVIVLFQRGKGAAMGSAFGGSSQTLFGSRGPATAMAKITTAAAVIFMITSITLSVMSSRATQQSVVGDTQPSMELPTTMPERETAGPTGGEGSATEPVGPVGPVESGESSSQ